MDEREHPRRRTSLLRLLAAALAGGLGAFGIPVGGHANTPSPATSAPPAASASDAMPQ
jgi:hypothetical protein